MYKVYLRYNMISAFFEYRRSILNEKLNEYIYMMLSESQRGNRSFIGQNLFEHIARLI